MANVGACWTRAGTLNNAQRGEREREKANIYERERESTTNGPHHGARSAVSKGTESSLSGGSRRQTRTGGDVLTKERSKKRAGTRRVGGGDDEWEGEAASGRGRRRVGGGDGEWIGKARGGGGGERERELARGRHSSERVVKSSGLCHEYLCFLVFCYISRRERERLVSVSLSSRLLEANS